MYLSLSEENTPDGIDTNKFFTLIDVTRQWVYCKNT